MNRKDLSETMWACWAAGATPDIILQKAIHFLKRYFPECFI
jgi:hypothetical protein